MAHVMPDRRAFLATGLAAVVPGLRGDTPTAWQRARELVQGGELGPVAYCRMSGGTRGELLDAVRFVFGEAKPRAVADQDGTGATRRATFQYPGFIASWEDRPEAHRALSIHGANATLTLSALPHTYWKLEVSSS
jgi:predicted dehydrogenase